MKMIQNLLAGLCVLTTSTVIAETNYSEMIVFGDSLSDPGNAFVLSGSVSVRPYNAGNIPDAPYPVGGLHFSNGETWAERLSASLNLTGGTGPALRAPNFTNYAFGGARAASSAGGPFDMSAQVGQYLANTGGIADGDALYAVFFGGNDVRDALVAFNTVLLSGGSFPDAQAAAEAILADAITTFADNIIALSSQGARNFIIPNVPNIGLAPATRELGPGAQTLATQLSFGFNVALEDALSNIEMALPVNITRFDVFSLISGIVAAPNAFGIKNAENACITPEVNRGAVCTRPDDYLFWDGIHPTRAGHKLLAETAFSTLQ